MQLHFHKSELKTGMMVELCNGMRYTVMLDTCMDGRNLLTGGKNGYGWLSLDKYNDSLVFSDKGITEKDDTMFWSVKRVYAPNNVGAVGKFKDHHILWERMNSYV